MAEPLLEAAGLTYSYPAAARPALGGLDLTIDRGDFVLLSGASASGKTTLLRAACGLVPHYYGGSFAGDLRLGGHSVREVGPAEMASLVGYVAQEPESQIVSSTVGAELELPLELRGIAPGEIARRVVETATSLGIEGLLERTTDSLSGGELQRVAIAAALITHPPLLLLDEPTSQLDPAGAEELLALLARLNERLGLTIVVGEHRLERCLAVAGRVVRLEGGRVSFDGPAERFAEPRLPVLARGDRTRSSGPVLSVRDLRVALEAGPQRTEVLRGVDLELRRGERIALVGANGAGKSTLLRACAGLLEPLSGAVSAPAGCALLTQRPDDYLVAERIEEELPGELGRAALAAVGLELSRHDLGRDPHDLSGGQRQRLALAIAMAGRGAGGEPPGLVCLDEPTRGLDRVRKRRLANWLRGLSTSAAVIVATHDAELADDFADRVILLDSGLITADRATRSGMPEPMARSAAEAVPA